MTEFAVTPPTLWLGMLKVGKVVRVRFDAVLQPSESGASRRTNAQGLLRTVREP